MFHNISNIIAGQSKRSKNEHIAVTALVVMTVTGKVNTKVA